MNQIKALQALYDAERGISILPTSFVQNGKHPPQLKHLLSNLVSMFGGGYMEIGSDVETAAAALFGHSYMSHNVVISRELEELLGWTPVRCDETKYGVLYGCGFDLESIPLRHRAVVVSPLDFGCGQYEELFSAKVIWAGICVFVKLLLKG